MIMFDFLRVTVQRSSWQHKRSRRASKEQKVGYVCPSIHGSVRFDMYCRGKLSNLPSRAAHPAKFPLFVVADSRNEHVSDAKDQLVVFLLCCLQSFSLPQTQADQIFR